MQLNNSQEITQQKFHITALDDYRMFKECIVSCTYGLKQLGYQVTYADNQLEPDAVNIVFGSHCKVQTWKEMSSVADKIIVYNWEPASPLIARFSQSYLRILQNAHVWDYSQRNVHELKNHAGIQDIHHVPMGYAPEITSIEPAAEQDIDVLFYGDLHDRRRKVINQLREKGLNVVTNEQFGWIGDELRDELIARSKVVLNMHAFGHIHIFEMARVSYWLANSKAVVTEVSDDTEIDPMIKDSIVHGKIDELADLCFDLVRDSEKRLAYEKRGFDAFSKIDPVNIMKEAVERYFSQLKENKIGNDPNVVLPMPSIMKVGSGVITRYFGDQFNYSYCNVDSRSDYCPDIVLDLGKEIPFDSTFDTWRFGKIHFQNEMFDKIITKNYFEKVDDLVMALTNCLNLLKNGGLLEIIVPMDSSLEAWIDIDTRRAFNKETWKRALDNWWRYGWETYKFDIVSTGYNVHHDTGFEWLRNNNEDWAKGLNFHRVVDSQSLVLFKRELTDNERRALPQYQFLD